MTPSAMTSIELYGLAPIITLPIGARRLGPRSHIAFVTVVGIAVATAFAVNSWRDACQVQNGACSSLRGLDMFGGQMVLDRFGILITVMTCLAALVAIMLSVHYLRVRDQERGEVFALICFTAAGMSGLAMSTDLLSLFVCLELLSVVLL